MSPDLKATEIYKDNSRVWGLRVVGESLFHFLNSGTIDMQPRPSPPPFQFLLKKIRQSQNATNPGANQDLILNIKILSPFLHLFLYDLHAAVRVSHGILHKENSQRLSVYGAKRNQRKCPERPGLKPTRTTNSLSANSSSPPPAARSRTKSLRKSAALWEERCQHRGHFISPRSGTGGRGRPDPPAQQSREPPELLQPGLLQPCVLLHNVSAAKAATQCQRF